MSEVGEFRTLLATAPGRVPKPPVRCEPPGTTVRINEVPGLVYRSEFMGGDEEAAGIREIDGSEWIEELRRRVQHYGWRYDYRERTVRDSMRLGSLPEWAKPIAERLVPRRVAAGDAGPTDRQRILGESGNRRAHRP